MWRRLAAVAAGLVLGAASLVSPGLVLPAQAATTDAKAASIAGLDEFGACMAGAGRGSLVFLIDQSGSLRQSDPDKARVTAGHYLADRLASFAQSAKVTLDVRVAGFAADYAAAGEWTAISEASSGAIKQTITQVGEDIKNFDTDYWNALEGARADLVGHDSSGCRAIAWFSDGAFDLDVRTSDSAKDQFGTDKGYAPGADLSTQEGTAAAEQAGVSDLCRPTGVVDQTRAAGITILGIGLNDGSADFSLMRRITEAAGKDVDGLERCGDQTQPVGEFYPVSDIDSLLMAFDSIAAAGTTVDTRNISICQAKACTQGEVAFVLDGALDEAHILASSSVDGLDAYLYRPGQDEPLVLSSRQTQERQDEGVTSRWITPRTLEISADAAHTPAWDGVWRLAFVDNAAASQGEEIQINLKLSSPAQLVWEDLSSTELRAGETVKDVQLRLYDRPDGAPVDPQRITGTLNATVTLQDAQGQQVTLFETDDAADLAGGHDITVPADLAPGAATMTRTITLTTPDATGVDGARVPGTTLSPTVVTEQVTLVPPLNFPTVAAALTFPLLEKETAATGTVGVSGPGCVWLDPGAVTLTGAPAEAGEVTISSSHSSAESCLEVADGATADLEVSLSTKDHANGSVTGSLEVSISPLGHADQARSTTVAFNGEMRRPLNVTTTSAAFVAALVLGIAVPILLLYLVKYLMARVPAGGLVIGRTVVEVPSDGQPPNVDLSSRDLKQLAVRKGTRELSTDGYVLRAHPGLAPTSVPQVRLDQPQAPSVSGSLEGQRGGHAVLPLSVRGNWVVVLDQPDSPRTVTLLVFSPSLERSDIDRITQDAAKRLPSRVATLAASNRGMKNEAAGANQPGPAAAQATVLPPPSAGASGFSTPMPPAGSSAVSPVPVPGTAPMPAPMPVPGPSAPAPGAAAPGAPVPGSASSLYGRSVPSAASASSSYGHVPSGPTASSAPTAGPTPAPDSPAPAGPPPLSFPLPGSQGSDSAGGPASAPPPPGQS